MQIKNQHAFTWHTTDIRNAVDELNQTEQEKFYEMVGESDRDLRTYFECLLEDRQDMIIQYINEQIADAVTETIQYDEKI